MTQNAKLIRWLETHDGITTFEATVQLGICRVSERIRECERLGWVFEHTPEKTPSGARVVRYRLVSQPDSAIAA